MARGDARAAPARAPSAPAPTSRRRGRIVVKVGSTSLTSAVGGLDPARLDTLVDSLAALGEGRRRGRSWSPPARSPPGWRRSACRGVPRDLATQQAAASVGQGLLVARYADAFARHGLHGRPGAAHRRGRHPAHPLPQRPAHALPAARARRRPGGQRERHRGHPRDPLRRQRPPRRAGGAPRPRRRPAPALGRRRAVRRAAAPPRRPPDRARCADRTTWRRDGRQGRLRGRRHRRHAHQGARPPRSRRRRAIATLLTAADRPAPRWPATTSAPGSPPPGSRGAHPAALAGARGTPRAASCSTPEPCAVVDPARMSLLPAGIVARRRGLRRGRSGRPV